MTITETEKTKQKIGNLNYFTLFFNFVLVLVLFFSSFFGDKSARWIFLFPPKNFFLNFFLKKKRKMLKAVVGMQTRELANEGRLPQKKQAIRVAAGRRGGRKTSDSGSSTRRQTRRSARQEWVLVLAGGRRRPQNRHPNGKKKKRLKKIQGGKKGGVGGVGFSSKLAIFRENRF
jgi:hypothetical protein